MSNERFNPASLSSAAAAAATAAVPSPYAQTSDISIPKLIHFIWAGGERRVPIDDMQNALQWAINNPDWEINLWVDEATDPDVIQSGHYQNMIRRLLDDLQFSDLDPGIKENLLNRIHVYDISNNPTGVNFRNEYVAYEIDKLMPNYGSSSDLLRLMILEVCGGAYFDFDVYPGKNRLSEIPLQSLNRHQLYIDHCSQIPTLHQEILEDFNNWCAAGNDTLISTKNNPLLTRLLDTVYRNYNNTIPWHSAYGGTNNRDTTVKRTGPDIIDKLLLASRLVGNYRLLDDVEILRTRDGRHLALSQPAEANTEQWILLFAKRKEYDVALESLRKTINFEMKHFGIIRVEDHINDLTIACNIDRNDVDAFHQAVTIPVLDCCQPHLHSKPLVQVTGRTPYILDYFQRNSCETLIDLNAVYLKKVLDLMLKPWFLQDKIDQTLFQHISNKIKICVTLLHDRLEIMAGIINASNKFTPVQHAAINAKLGELLNTYSELASLLATNDRTAEMAKSLADSINTINARLLKPDATDTSSFKTSM